MKSQTASITSDIPTRLRKNPEQSLIVQGVSHAQKCRQSKKELKRIGRKLQSFCFDLEYQNELDLIRKVLETPRFNNRRPLIGQSTRKISSTIDVAPHIDGYKIVEHLGTGGSATVWKAFHLASQSFVAIKILGETIEERAAFRLANEYRILTSIHHPNLLNAFTMGLVEGRLWLGMEYCSRGSLRNHLHQPWGYRPSAKLICQLAKATQVIHNKGILHCDIKPGNILLNQSFKPKLADFDLAQTLETGGNHSKPVGISGTPAYMAPEQVLKTKIDHRTDIHGLGAVLYHMLTGHPPFRANSIEEVLPQIVHQIPSFRLTSNCRIPPRLLEISSKCLQKHPAGRYQTSLELAADLDRFLNYR